MTSHKQKYALRRIFIPPRSSLLVGELSSPITSLRCSHCAESKLSFDVTKHKPCLPMAGELSSVVGVRGRSHSLILFALPGASAPRTAFGLYPRHERGNPPFQPPFESSTNKKPEYTLGCFTGGRKRTRTSDLHNVNVIL